MRLAPIALFAFKRPDHLIKTLSALKANELANESDLFVFADGPRNQKEAAETEKVKLILREIEGFRAVKLIERDENIGLSASIISGVSQLTYQFGRVIVLEDDLVTDRYFLTYMNEALNLFESTEDVGCIHGYVYPMKNPMSTPFFLKGADCWGWATWDRAWRHFDPDGKRLLSVLKERGLVSRFDFNGSYPFTRMLKDQIKGKNDSWAIRWSASLMLADRLCLYPDRTLVRNIGLDGSGVHCSANLLGYELNSKKFESYQPKIQNIEVGSSEEAFLKFSEYFRQTFPRRSLFQRIRNRMIHLR